MNGRRFVERLPPWMGSIRVRLTVLYSTVLFGLAALVVFGIYTGVSRSLNDQPVSQTQEWNSGLEGVFPPNADIEFIPLEEFERRVNTRALAKLREYSFTALGLLFIGSLGTGWIVSGRVLRPIGRINGVAREIQATDLSRRIHLRGPND
jgi:hypothetical protein